MAHGGPNPVVGATVTLYATQSNGYGGAGLQLAQTTTADDGSFTFNPASYTCPTGQHAYIASVDGDMGGNTNDVNSFLMAALGPCSSLSSSTYIWVDELITMATAYALDNFITISGNTVNISAPANNNASTRSCSDTGSAMTCVFAGLAHAFLNAANLVDAVGSTSSSPSGQANIYAATRSSGAL